MADISDRPGLLPVRLTRRRHGLVWPLVMGFALTGFFSGTGVRCG